MVASTSKWKDPAYSPWLEDCTAVNLEMEGSGIFTVARRLHCRAAAIYGCSSNLVSNEIYYADGTMEKENTKLVNAWDTEIRIALETICRFDRIKDTLGMDL